MAGEGSGSEAGEPRALPCLPTTSVERVRVRGHSFDSVDGGPWTACISNLHDEPHLAIIVSMLR